MGHLTKYQTILPITLYYLTRKYQTGDPLEGLQRHLSTASLQPHIPAFL